MTATSKDIVQHDMRVLSCACLESSLTLLDRLGGIWNLDINHTMRGDAGGIKDNILPRMVITLDGG